MWPRSLRADVLGEACWDPGAQRFTSFELVAIGARTGRTTFNGRAREEQGSEHRIGFLFRTAPQGDRVAPTFVNLYRAPWVKKPAR